MPEQRWLNSTEIVRMVSAAEARKIREAEAARLAVPSSRMRPGPSVPDVRVIWALVAVSVVGLVLWAYVAGG